MRKYIITPALLAIVCMVMCHCTFNRKASVAANEYLIQGELANLPDSIVIGLYEEDGSILNCVWRDTLMNGQFSFRDTVSTTRKMLIMSDNRGFPGTWLEVWIAPGEYIEIKGQDKLVKTWEVVSMTKSYVIASEGTYTKTDGLYTYTATKSYEVTGGMGLYDVTNLKTAVLCLDTASTSYRVYYWYTTTIGEEVENYQKVYASSNAKVTLKKIGSIMVLDNDGIVTSGTYSTSKSTNVTAITNGKSTAYK